MKKTKECSPEEFVKIIKERLSKSEVKIIENPPFLCFVCNNRFYEGDEYVSTGYKIGSIQLSCHKKCYDQEINPQYDHDEFLNEED